MINKKCKILFQNGRVLEGKSLGYIGTTGGEVCFNTGMTGYQEILTDPSYKGQMVTMTYPHIGNYGVNHEDVQTFRQTYPRKKTRRKHDKPAPLIHLDSLLPLLGNRRL